jgi:tetratricopeptide (TPR) repeat protein
MGRPIWLAAGPDGHPFLRGRGILGSDDHSRWIAREAARLPCARLSGMTPKMSPTSTTETAPSPLEEALALHREGKHELAMQRYVAILQKNPGDIDALYYVAMIAIQQGQFGEGIRVIEHALTLGTPQARFYNLLGQAHLRLNQDDEALKSFSHAIETDPAFVDAYGNRAALLAEMGRPQEAVSDFDRALQLRPANAEDLCNRAGVLADLGRLDEALDGFDRALTLMPSLAPAYFNRGSVLMRLGRPRDALRDYDESIRLHEAMAPAHVGRAQALEALGRHADAKASLDRAASLDPKLRDTTHTN